MKCQRTVFEIIRYSLQEENENAGSVRTPKLTKFLQKI